MENKECSYQNPSLSVYFCSEVLAYVFIVTTVPVKMALTPGLLCPAKRILWSQSMWSGALHDIIKGTIAEHAYIIYGEEYRQ